MSVASRLPAHLEISGMIRAVEAAGGFASIIAKGERDAGTILVVCCVNGTHGRLFERMPGIDGNRKWTLIRSEDIENKAEFSDYLARRHRQDPDTWILELDIAEGERFIEFDR